MYTKYIYTYMSTIYVQLICICVFIYSFTSMYTKYKHHTLLQVCILNKNTRI